jgi:hypothetical protein
MTKPRTKNLSFIKKQTLDLTKRGQGEEMMPLAMETIFMQRHCLEMNLKSAGITTKSETRICLQNMETDKLISYYIYI